MKKAHILKLFYSILKKDKQLYFGFQSNIAMSFFNEYYRNSKKYKNRKDIHTISNNAAIEFLNLIINIRIKK